MEDHYEIDPGEEFLVRGHITNFDSTGTKGLITRIGNDDLSAWFHRSAVFINGKKLIEEEILWDVLTVGSPIRAVIGPTKSCFIKNSEVFYRAIVAWQGTLPFLPEFNPNCSLTREVDYHPPKDHLVVTHNGGVVHWANRNEGIIRIFGVNLSHIIFKNSIVFIGGNRLQHCDALHRLMVYFSKCEVKAHRINPMNVYGMCVSWEAIKVSFPTPQQPLELPLEDEILPTVNKQKQDKVIYSYFTGRVKSWGDNKMYFGSGEHTAAIDVSSVYIHGRKLSSIKELGDALQKNSKGNADGLIFHSFVYLPNNETNGQVNYDTVKWEASYAWQGEIPDDVKEIVQKYVVKPMSAQVSRITQNTSSPLKNKTYLQQSKSNGYSFRTIEQKLTQLPLHGKHGTISGFILIADESHALLTSFDTIVFCPRENFYVNGDKFGNSDSLKDYFKGKKIPVRAHTVPLKETRVILGCRVTTLGFCVWIGKEPDISRSEWNKAYKVNPSTIGEVDILSSNVNFSYLIGTISALDNFCAVLDCNTGSVNVNVAFWSSCFYLYGTQFYSDYTLLDKSGILKSSKWCLLAYPVVPISVLNKRITHIGIAVWHYQNQHQMLEELLNVMAEVPRPLDYDVFAGDRNYNSRSISEKSIEGWIVDIFENYGIVQSKSIPFGGTYAIFWKQNVYVDGNQFPAHLSLRDLSQNQPYFFTFVSVALQNINNYLVSVESVMFWIGKKPILSNSNNKLLESPSKQTLQKAFEDFHIENKESNNNSKESMVSKANDDHLEDDNTRGANKVKSTNGSHIVAVVAKHGQVCGNLLMANATQALITSYEDIVFFSHLNFFVDGERFPKQKSMYEYLKGKKVEVSAFVVPMDAPKVVFNCRVASQAIAAWIGEEPDELMSLKVEYHQGMLPEGQPEDCPRNENDDDVVFSYMTGNVEFLSETAGVLHSNTEFGLVKVAFWNKALYLYGSKLHGSTSLIENSAVLESSTWSILAYPITERLFLGDTVTHCAAAVWHYNNQYQILRDILQITSSKAREIRLETQGADVTANGDTKKLMSRHMAGWCVKACKDFGVIQCGSRLTLKKLNIYFHRSNFWLDGKQVPSHIPIYNVHNLQSRQCNVIAAPIQSKEFEEFEITMEASVVWVGKKPLHLLEQDIEERSSEPKYGKPSHPKENSKVQHSYKGKHVTGKLLTVQKKFGVGVWKSAELGGFLFFKFDSKDIFVDGHIMIDKTLNFNGYFNRVCNFYVIPCEAIEFCGYPCQLIATCGWMGTKPIFIPAPGNQQAARITLPKPQLQETFNEPLQANMNDDNSNAITDSYHITAPRPLTEPRGLSSPLDATIPKLPCALADVTAPKVLMGPDIKALTQKDFSGYLGNIYTTSTTENMLSLVTTTHDVSSANSQRMLHSNNFNSIMSPIITNAKFADTSLSSLQTQQGSPNLLQVKSNKSSPKLQTPKQGMEKVAATDIWGDEKTTICRGEVVEIHSKIGRLKGVDGILHYFSASNCFLHGVSLKEVELWHVLMQGQEVEYILSEASLGPIKVDCVWIGSQTVGDIQRAGMFIYEWCKNNMVPDGAREILVQQLQAS